MPLIKLILTKGLLAVQDMEVVMHAGCQQQVLLGRMPLQPPYATAHRNLTERLLHVPTIPQQYLFIVATQRHMTYDTRHMS